MTGTWIFRGLVLALLGAVAYGQWRQGLLEPVLPAPAGAALPALDRRLASVESTLRLQSTALGQALGQAVPVQLADTAEAELTGLERALATPAAWPADAAQVQSLNARLLQVLQPLPPWAQDALLPRLLPLKWSIQALWILRSPVPEAREDLVNFQTNVQAHLDAVPDGVLPALRSEVEQRRDSVSVTLRKVTLKDAEAAIKAPPPEGAPRDRQLQTAAALLGTLTGADDDDARRLRRELEDLALRLAAEKVLAESSAQRAKARQTGDDALLEHASQQARQGLMDLRLRLAELQPPPGSALANLLQKVRDEVKAIDQEAGRRHAERTMRYQKAALEALKSVKLLGLTDIGDEKKKALADQLIRLAWIDRGLLDVAVADWFQTVYKQGFDQLSDQHKRRVVEAFATTPKRGLD